MASAMACRLHITSMRCCQPQPEQRASPAAARGAQLLPMRTQLSGARALQPERRVAAAAAAADTAPPPPVKPEAEVPQMTAFLDGLKWDSNGLVVAIAQHVDTGEVLMQAFADRAAVNETLQTR